MFLVEVRNGSTKMRRLGSITMSSKCSLGFSAIFTPELYKQKAVHKFPGQCSAGAFSFIICFSDHTFSN